MTTLRGTNIFLTGERGAGKSTIIRRFVNALDFSPAGFQTLATETDESGRDALVICPYDVTREAPVMDADASQIIAVRDKPNQTREIRKEAFDETGAEILRRAREAAPPPKLLIMDELGFMEREANAFQKEVFNCLNSGIPVLGVLKNVNAPFLETIREREDVSVFTVTPENREEVFLALKMFLFQQN